MITVSAFKSDFRNLIFLSDPAVNNLQQRHSAIIVLQSTLATILHRSKHCFYLGLMLVPHCHLDDVTRQIVFFFNSHSMFAWKRPLVLVNDCQHNGNDINKGTVCVLYSDAWVNIMQQQIMNQIATFKNSFQLQNRNQSSSNLLSSSSNVEWHFVFWICTSHKKQIYTKWHRLLD